MIHHYDEVLNDIDVSSMRSTRNSSYQIRKHMIVDEIKQHLKNSEVAYGTYNKIAEAEKIFKIIKNNNWFLKENPRFNTTVKNKLLEFIDDRNNLISMRARRWYYELYDTSILN